MEKNVIMAIVLGALVVIAALQAFQLLGLKNTISDGGVQTSSVNAPAPAAGGGVPQNLQNLPSMVGGC